MSQRNALESWKAVSLACSLLMLAGAAIAQEPAPAGGAAAGSAAADGGAKESADVIFGGMCDASAVVLLAGDSFVVADDRSNLLRYYLTSGGASTGSLNVYQHTEVGQRSWRNYSAIEGAARIGDEIFWIGSHARDTRKGANRPNWRRLFATKVVAGPRFETLEPVGKSYSNLSKVMESSELLEKARLKQAILLAYRELDHLSPKRNGLNIEGLAASRDGEQLLLGLRNPLLQGRAIIVPVENPKQLITGIGKARFGEPIMLDLGGYGISGLEYSEARDRYLVLATPHQIAGGYRLYEWTAELTAQPRLIATGADTSFNAQGMAITADGKRALLVSDDGRVFHKVQKREECRNGPRKKDQMCPCERLADPAKQQFRARWIELPAL